MAEILRSYASARRLAIGTVIAAAETSVLRRVAGAVALDYGAGRQIHAFDFGGVVLLGVSPEDAAPVLDLLREPGRPLDHDTFLLEDGDPVQVTFNAVRLPGRAPDLLRVVARVLAQSSAIDRLEGEIDRLLRDVETVVGELRDHGRITRTEDQLARFIGVVLHTRGELVSGLAVLDKPEETWEDQRSSDLHQALVRNFEIEERFKLLDQKLDLVQDAIEVITDMWRSRHATKLEWLVILLISVEIVLALAERVGLLSHVP